MYWTKWMPSGTLRYILYHIWLTWSETHHVFRYIFLYIFFCDGYFLEIFLLPSKINLLFCKWQESHETIDTKILRISIYSRPISPFYAVSFSLFHGRLVKKYDDSFLALNFQNDMKYPTHSCVGSRSRRFSASESFIAGDMKDHIQKDRAYVIKSWAIFPICMRRALYLCA